jgi:hypothetical protein
MSSAQDRPCTSQDVTVTFQSAKFPALRPRVGPRRAMPRNPWLAIDASTSPIVLARTLRREWENFIGRAPVELVRAPVAASWRRSLRAGVQPVGSSLPAAVLDGDEAAARWEVHPLASAAPLMDECLAGVAEDAQHLVVVSDADGVLLSIQGDARIRQSAAASMNFTEGALWRETSAGTNAIGTALAADHSVQIFAGEHFKEIAHAWTCSAAPMHDPDTGELLGTVGLIAKLTAVHPHSLAVAVATARAVEMDLRCRLHERHDELRLQYRPRIFARGGRRALVTPSGTVLSEHPTGWLGAARLAPHAGGGELVVPSGARAFAEPVGHEEAFIVRALHHQHAARCRPVLKVSLLGRDRAAVQLGGRVLELGRRHTEILALLCARRAGMTSEELAAELWGDAGRPDTVRVHVCRLRRLLGPWIDTAPYRLSIDLDCDVTHVQSLLDRGAVRRAVGCYGGPLLPRSQAPGVVRERDALECWLRQAVMTGDDVEALWAWVRSESGREDLSAWQRLLAHLAFRDPRRSLAAACVNALRAAYA